MANEPKFRHEYKHEINMSDQIIIRQRMNAVAQLDSHARDGKYYIRSLYFDNLQNSALLEKVNGVNKREKFRIRYYNDDISNIKLEKKSKDHGLCNKISCKIAAAEVIQLLNGDYSWMPDSGRPLIVELYSKMNSMGLRPKTIVDYTREPFIYGPGNVRVTMDYDLRTTINVNEFLDYKCLSIPVIGAPIILEVKWDEFLPSISRDAVGLRDTRSKAFSKYASCRVYG